MLWNLYNVRKVGNFRSFARTKILLFLKFCLKRIIECIRLTTSCALEVAIPDAFLAVHMYLPACSSWADKNVNDTRPPIFEKWSSGRICFDIDMPSLLQHTSGVGQPKLYNDKIVFENFKNEMSRSRYNRN